MRLKYQLFIYYESKGAKIIKKIPFLPFLG